MKEIKMTLTCKTQRFEMRNPSHTLVATERRNAKEFNYPRGRPEELLRTWNNGNDSTVREEPKRGKSESGGEGGIGEETGE